MEREEETKSSKKRRGLRVVVWISAAVIAIFALCGSFFLGYRLREKRMNEELRTIDWVITQIKKQYYADFTEAEIIEAATSGLETLLDAYSRYYTEEEYREAKRGMQGYKLGIGVSLTTDERNRVVVYRVLGGSPAEEAGFVKNEVILGVKQAGEGEFTSCPNFDAFSAALAALPDNQPLEFQVEHDGEIRIRRAAKEEFVQKTAAYYDEEQIAFLPETAAYIRFDTFTGKAEEDFAAAMQTFRAKGKTQLILDLRDNGGGNVSILANVASYLVKAEKGAGAGLMRVRYKGDGEEYYVTDPSVYADYGFTAVKVLLNQNSASASEALVGAMLDSGSITADDLFGCRSYGKGIMQTTFTEPFSGEAMKLTTARIHWPVSDTCIQGVGILPGNEVEENASSLTYDFSRDAVLSAAIASLS